MPEAPIQLQNGRPARSTPAGRRQLRALVRAGCRNQPGVYRMLDARGLVIYVGQSRVLRTRLLSHFRGRGRRNKSARILHHTFHIEWEYTATEFSALLRELRLIKKYRPRFNSMLVADDWPRAYVSLTGGEVPGLRVVSTSDDPEAVALFGPFRKVHQLRDAVRVLSETMGIRDCDRSMSAHGRAGGNVRSRVAGCIRHETGSCPAPCMGLHDAAGYLRDVEAVRSFLEGQNREPLDRLEYAMVKAAESLAFERASVLRDKLGLLGWLHERVRHFHANVDRLTFRYDVRASDGKEWIYLVRRGTIRAEMPAPATEAENQQLSALIDRVYSGPDPSGVDIPTHDLDEFHLVASWFRRHPDEMQHTTRIASAQQQLFSPGKVRK